MAKPRSEQKKDDIFKAALKLFSHNGFSKTTIKDIAAEAGVSFGTVFTYYENKDALFTECVNRPLQLFKEVINETKKDLADLTEEKLKDIIRKHLDLFMESEKELRIVQYVIGQPDRFSEINALDEFVVLFLGYIQEIVHTGMEKGFLPKSNPEEVGYGYLAFLMGARLTYSDQAYPMFTRAFTNQAYRLFGMEGKCDDENI
ncbi:MULTISPECIES: TetR/AcrR family transcriptional regulator [Bacillaceae]|uniref:TetR/AcrR family transcriptional regulator n=1 Tax=Bacillaceae TaxID=186817 RepID=UPI0004E23472|nr:MULTISPECIES: TetR/AcrR family transcriptional regulator [Bacillaceae]MCM3362153.1 TetR/AcrR family transcriptional regulator [Niallia sp. MER TA 168]